MSAALVTGASAGIDAQFARALAARGGDLVLIARGEQVLHALSSELRARHGVRVEVVVCDLAVEHAARSVRQRTDALGLHIDLLVNNAGFATAGRFEQLDPATDHTQAMLNVVAVVDLTHQYLPGMSTATTARSSTSRRSADSSPPRTWLSTPPARRSS